MSNAEMLRGYANHLTAGGRSKGTIQLRVSHIRRLLCELGVDVAGVDTASLEGWIAGKNWGLASKRSARASIRSFFGWAQAVGYISDNPAGGLPSIKSPRGVPSPCPDAYICDALGVTDLRVKIAVELMATAGLRRAECACVRGCDAIPIGTGWGLRVNGKGGHQRIVPISPKLGRFISQRQGWLFQGGDHGHISPGYLGKIVSRALPAGWTAHKLRHRFATVAYSQSKDLRAVQELLGHASMSTTVVYTAIDVSSLHEAAAAAWSIAA